MKNLIFLFFFIPFLALAQEEPFKGANTLVIHTEETDLFQKIGKQLIEDGYQIESSNQDFKTISTAWREVKWIKYKLVISVLDSGFQIQGRMINEGANAVLNSTGSDWLLEWKKSGVEQDTWEKLEDFGSHFGSDKKYFAK